jgi:kynureninase
MLDLRDAYVLPPAPAAELRAFTHGLMPRAVPERMAQFAQDWAERGVDAWNSVPNHWRPGSGEAVGWWSLPTYLGDHFVAPMLGAPRSTCILQPNVHWTMQCVLSAPEVAARGSEIVVTDLAFPSVLHSAQQWGGLLGMTPRIVARAADGFVDRDAVLEAMSPETALVALSHVGFTSGEKLPDAFLREVAERCRECDALFVIDGYHATASLPLDVGALGCDVYVGGLLKEASGSSGNAYLYVREGLELSPRLTGWFGDADPFGFRESPQAHPDVRRRFLAGTTAVASMYHAVEGLRILLGAGLEAVRADSLAKTARAIERADALGLRVRSPREAERRGAMVIVEVEAADRLCAYLKQHAVYTDSRQGRYLRLAPFVWNPLADVDRCFDALAETLSSGAHLRMDHSALSEGGPVT